MTRKMGILAFGELLSTGSGPGHAKAVEPCAGVGGRRPGAFLNSLRGVCEGVCGRAEWFKPRFLRMFVNTLLSGGSVPIQGLGFQ